MKNAFTTVAAFQFILLAVAGQSHAADFPEPTPGDYFARDFHFRSGDTLPELRIHYRTLGKPRRDNAGTVQNAVLIMHGTTGSGEQFLGRTFAGELFGKGQLLDADKYFLILPDDIGHGKSSKPSDGLHAKFPQYGYFDMLAAEHLLLTDGLTVNHLRLVMGTSMGGMHTWLWGEQYPDFMDALMPLASLPTSISGRNRMWRKMCSESIRSDPEWKGGEYTSQPHGLRFASEMFLFVSSSARRRFQEAPTLAQADKLLDDSAANMLKRWDANDILYAVESSRDYDPGPGLEQIVAPLVAINFADDLINPPELGILEREIKRVKHGTAIVIPESEKTNGHGTHTLAAVWKEHLAELLKASEK